MRWIVVPAILLCLLFTRGALGAVTLDEILDQVKLANSMQSERMRFQQRIDLSLLLFSWQFTADVTKDGDQLAVVVGKGAPAFVPNDMSSALVDIPSAIHMFDLTLVGEERSGGRVYYIIEGERKATVDYGAQSGRLWVDSQEWYIAKANVAYTWGRLEVEQEYRDEKGRRVLHRQTAVARPIGARVKVDYTDYWFDDGESDIL